MGLLPGEFISVGLISAGIGGLYATVYGMLETRMGARGQKFS